MLYRYMSDEAKRLAAQLASFDFVVTDVSVRLTDFGKQIVLASSLTTKIVQDRISTLKTLDEETATDAERDLYRDVLRAVALRCAEYSEDEGLKKYADLSEMAELALSTESMDFRRSF